MQCCHDSNVKMGISPNIHETGPTKYRSKSSYHGDRNITTKVDINLFTPRDRKEDCLQNPNSTPRPSPSEEQVRKDRTNKLATSIIRFVQ